MLLCVSQPLRCRCSVFPACIGVCGPVCLCPVEFFQRTLELLLGLQKSCLLCQRCLQAVLQVPRCRLQLLEIVVHVFYLVVVVAGGGRHSLCIHHAFCLLKRACCVS